MPRNDRTGPVGHGPRTGRGMGHCAEDVQADGESQRGSGMGWGPGPGYGRGRRSMQRPMGGRRRVCRHGLGAREWDESCNPWPAAQADTGYELEQLGAQASRLQQGLDAIRTRMDELQGSGLEE